MHSQIFVNLPVKDLKRSVDFFTKLGYTFNPQFTDENATCMILGENLYVMLLVEKFFSTFTSKGITYKASRAGGVGHADVAWAIMHALFFEPLDSSEGTDGASTMEIC